MKKYISKICTILFTLASLLLINWSIDIDQVAARSSLPLDFNQHYTYNKGLPNANYRISWELDVDFPRGRIRAQWIFRVEQLPKNSGVWASTSETWVLTDEFIQDIQCVKHGNVKIQNGRAKFNPNTEDYITCETPSFKEVAEYMIEFLSLGGISVAGDVPNVCAGCIDPWMNAAIKIQSFEEGTYPIGYLSGQPKYLSQNVPNAQSIFPHSNPQSTIFQSEVRLSNESLMLNTYMSSWEDSERSQPSTFTPRKRNFFTGMNVKRFLHTLSARNQSQYSTPWTEYWSSVQSLASDVERAGAEDRDWFSWVENAEKLPVPREAQEYEMSNGTNIFYIGYNPETGDYFRGTMYNIGVDPGCVGF